MTLQELGQAIREKREAAGMSIDDVAARIKISSRILKSIEEGSLLGLPHAVYTKSFIRAFGQLVGFNPEELNAHLEELFPPESLDETSSEPSFRATPAMSYPGAGKRFAVLLGLLLILVGIGVGGWYVVANYGDDIVELVKKPFSAIRSTGGESQEPAPVPAGTTSGSAVSNNTLSSLIQPQSGRPAPPVPTASTPPPEGARSGLSGEAAPRSASPALAGVDAFEEARRPAAMASETPQAAQTNAAKPSSENAPALETPGEVRIVAQQQCWISSVADGVKGRAFTMRPNDTLVLNYTRELEVTIGNSAGVSIQHNGKAIHSPGGAWQAIVMRFPSETRDKLP